MICLYDVSWAEANTLQTSLAFLKFPIHTVVISLPRIKNDTLAHPYVCPPPTGSMNLTNSHRFVVSAGMGRAVVFWNSYTMNVLARRDGHGATVRHCLVDDRSDRVITISADKAVRCWDSATFRCIQVCSPMDWEKRHRRYTLRCCHFRTGSINLPTSENDGDSKVFCST